MLVNNDNNKGNPRKHQEKKPGDKIVGILTQHGGKLQLDPCDKKQKSIHYDLDAGNLNGARAGDVVVAESVPAKGAPQVKVTRVLGQRTSPGILSLVSLYERGLCEEFSKAALNEAKTMTVPDLQGREDLRAIPLVTIDGADSRDFDDAVFAESTADGGFNLIVAIADVSWYVLPGSELDKEAYARGNSTYFPDRVVPMLPEDLSNGLCSLKPHEDRACMAFHMTIDKDGNLTDYKIARGLMNSAARLTYEQVQAAKDGKPDAVTGSLMDTVINPLYAAFAVLRRARDDRGAMNLDMPEYKADVDGKGAIINVGKAARPESCKVIEEFMVLANVAAASTLEDKQAPCVYRNHDKPPSALEGLRDYLGTFGLTLPAGEITSPAAFRDVLEQAAKTPNGHLITKAVMRVQAKARYATDNIGHFGLALKRYAHFTSPIRRYADLLVHRSLAEAFNMGQGALDATQKAQIKDMAEHISETEILSAKAERSAHDRFAAAFLSKKVGEEFTGRIVNATSAGLFVRLDKAGADGLLPMRGLPQDYYDLDKAQHTLTGQKHGRVYRTGATITVRLKDADGLTGSVLLEAANDNSADIPGLKFKKTPRPPADRNNGPRP